MRIIFTVEDSLGQKIDEAAEKVNAKKSDWIRDACISYLETCGSGAAGSEDENLSTIETLKKEIETLKDNIKVQIELRETFTKLIAEKDQRIEDLKESISRIEAMSITTTDQIAASKDERISDLTQMIDHLQAQAAAHSAAIQEAVKQSVPSIESKSSAPEIKKDEDGREYIPKPSWMFWVK
ncbi:MAG: hypothetical protein IKT21_07025 [Methanomicrobium sp.]|nr:hypothetical protein [Methanomicrobium sp.]